MVLIVDLGNTRLCLGLYDENKLVAKADLMKKKVSYRSFSSLLKKFIKINSIKKNQVNEGLICSVVPNLNEAIVSSIKDVFGFCPNILNHKMYMDLENQVDDIKEVGGDLIANVVGAKSKYTLPCLIVDLGTVTKNIIIDKNGQLVGVSFYPGVGTSADAMSNKAKLLPKLKRIEAPSYIVGKNTEQAMFSGIFYSTLGSIKNMGELVKKEYGINSSLILTGGYSYLYKNLLDEFIFDDELTLNGIYKLFLGIVRESSVIQLPSSSHSK